MDFDHTCSGFVLPGSGRGEIPPVWEDFFNAQTLKRRPVADPHSYFLLCRGLPDEIPETVPETLVEQMLWALICRPKVKAVVYPLFLSVSPGEPATVQKACRRCLGDITASGCIALIRPSVGQEIDIHGESGTVLNRIVSERLPAVIFSRALLKEKIRYRPGLVQRLPLARFKGQLISFLKSWLTLEQKIWLKRQLLRFYGGLQGKGMAEEELLAKKKTWEPAFCHPRIELGEREQDGRIAVLFAVHWLELGGAEKYAVDLIRALPVDRYRVFVITDIPSFNPWEERIRDRVEEVFHLPAFLLPNLAPVFYSYFLTTRKIRLVHIHHAPRFYESLMHVRRYHPRVKIVDTLHILELPPHSGGYPEMMARDCEVFIDCHHVISMLLKRFLMERWLVPEAKIQVNYLNVDTEYFDPAIVSAGRIRQTCRIGPETVLIGFVGRFTRQKRPLEFVKMAAELLRRCREENAEHPLHFLMVGGGTLKKDIEEAIRREGLEEKITMLGEMADTRSFYKDCDLVVMTSENEGLALVTYEAMAMETPIFSPDVGAQAELLSPEFLVPDESSVAVKLAHALWPYISAERRREETGRAARQYILEHHRTEQTFRKALELYDEMLDMEQFTSPP